MRDLQPHNLPAYLTRYRRILGLIGLFVCFKPVLPKGIRSSQGLCPFSSGCQQLCCFLVVGERVWVFCCGMLLCPGGRALHAFTESPGMELHIPQLYVLLWFSSEKAAFLSPAAFQVPILSHLAVPNCFWCPRPMVHTMRAIAGSQGCYITVYCIYIFFILKLGSIKQ